MVQAYAAVDRIHCLQFDDSSPNPEYINNIPVDKFLPCERDIESLRDEYRILIQRMICSGFDFFGDLTTDINHHIQHQYMTESGNKSKLIPLGVLDKDESRIADMVDIMDAYHQFVPGIPGETSPMPTILYGDGLSCERANDAKNARLNSGNPWDRLEGLHPAIQE
ncbi:hypothetical protein ScPMuIL_005982 [Solemya velum]